MYKCDLCTASFATKDGLAGHSLTIHHEEPIDMELLNCSCCQEWFTSLTALENHLMSVHMKSQSDAEKCPHCEKTYLTTAALLQHIICTHMKDQKDNDSYNCPFCTIKLKNISAFRDHIREHFLKKSKIKPCRNPGGDVKFKCHKCDAELDNTDELSRHLRAYHYMPKDLDKADGKNTANVDKQHMLPVLKKRKPAASKCRTSHKSAVIETSNELVDVNKPSVKENKNEKAFSEVRSGSAAVSSENETSLSNARNSTDQESLKKSRHSSEINDKIQKNLSSEKRMTRSSVVHLADQEDVVMPSKHNIDIPDKEFDISESEDINDPDKGGVNSQDDEDVGNEQKVNRNASNNHKEAQNDSDSSADTSYTIKKRSSRIENNTVSKRKKSRAIKRSTTSKRLTNKCSKSLSKKTRKPRSDTNVVCPHCVYVTFGSKSGLANHLKWVHKIAAPQYICNLCNKNFPRNKSLQAHMRTHDKIANQKCPLCNGLFITTELIDEHLVEVHKYSLDFVSLTFETLAEFEEWKMKEETHTISSFVKRNGTKKYPDGRSIDRFCCHRSGNYIPMIKSKRKRRSLGSNKTGFYCPAKIKLECSDEGIFVTYLNLHLGHTHELKRLRLSREEKVTVEKKLAQNVPFSDILNDVRDGVLDDSAQRLKLLSKKELNKFLQKYNLTREAALSDGFNLEAWINEMRIESNVIRAFKPVGSTLQGYKELELNDFFLIVARDCQIAALKKFGKFLICFDWIKGKNSCDNHLFILTVIDELNESYPCAFLYTNRCDRSIITIFFKMIHSLCSVKPKYFMTDIAEYFYDAWGSVFDTRKTRLLYCNWHLDKAWRTALIDLPHEKQIQVYRNLKVIMTENDREVFKSMCQSVLNELSEDEQTKSFAVYFKRFIDDPKPWARCYRICGHLRVCTALENMHMVLKCLYVGAGKVLSPDKSIYVLMKYLRDIHYDRAYPFLPKRDQPIKCNTDHLFSQHKSISNARVSIIYKSNKTWIVSLGKCPSRLYEVSLNKEDCNCQLICRECSFCIHYLRCACVDSSIKWNMCGHIHSVGRFLKAQKTSIITEEVCGQDLEFTAAFDDSNVLEEVIIEEKNDVLITDYFIEQFSADDNVTYVPIPTTIVVNEIDIKSQENSSKCDSLLEISSNATATPLEINEDKSINQNFSSNDISIATSKITSDERDVMKEVQSLKKNSLPENFSNSTGPIETPVSKGDAPKKVRSLKRNPLVNKTPVSTQSVDNKSNALMKAKLLKGNCSPNNLSNTPETAANSRGALRKKKSLKRSCSPKNTSNTTRSIESSEKKGGVSMKKTPTNRNLPLNNNSIPGPVEKTANKTDVLVKKKASKRNHSPNTSKIPTTIEATPKKRDLTKSTPLMQNPLPNNVPRTPIPVETTLNKRGVSKKEKSIKRISLPNKVSKTSVPIETTVNQGDISKKDKIVKKAKLNRLKEQTFKKFAKLLKSIETQEELELLTKSIPADRLLEKTKKNPSALGS